MIFQDDVDDAYYSYHCNKRKKTSAFEGRGL
jgi:hypothetical protein